MSADHDIIVYGRVEEGELDISGKPYPMSGWGWSCSCGQAGFGYATEAQAESYADFHLPLRSEG